VHLRITHVTRLRYDRPISESYTEMRLRPLDRAGQRSLGFRLEIEPREPVMEYRDAFGNAVHHFAVLQAHDHLEVVAESDVLTADSEAVPARALTPLDEWSYRQPTAYAAFSPEVAALGERALAAGDPEATARALCHEVFEALVYEKGATTVTTAAGEALRIGAGVCQDFAHVYLAAARSQGIAARYVSGYLYGPGDPLGGAGAEGGSMASHAWVDAFVPGYGWLALDPTHDAPQDGRYIRLAIGRDYADVPPTRGTYRGLARESLDVSVLISEA
jgi:transglutaminase-like putative cysteine protease